MTAKAKHTPRAYFSVALGRETFVKPANGQGLAAPLVGVAPDLPRRR